MPTFIIYVTKYGIVNSSKKKYGIVNKRNVFKKTTCIVAIHIELCLSLLFVKIHNSKLSQENLNTYNFILRLSELQELRHFVLIGRWINQFCKVIAKISKSSPLTKFDLELEKLQPFDQNNFELP